MTRRTAVVHGDGTRHCHWCSLDTAFAAIDALQAEAVGGGDYGAGQRRALREARQAIARRFLTDAMDATENREWE